MSGPLPSDRRSAVAWQCTTGWFGHTCVSGLGAARWLMALGQSRGCGLDVVRGLDAAERVAEPMSALAMAVTRRPERTASSIDARTSDPFRRSMLALSRKTTGHPSWRRVIRTPLLGVTVDLQVLLWCSDVGDLERICRMSPVRRLSRRPCGHDADYRQRADLPKLHGDKQVAPGITWLSDYSK